LGEVGCPHICFDKTHRLVLADPAHKIEHSFAEAD
jgi:hypothetical protein